MSEHPATPAQKPVRKPAAAAHHIIDHKQSEVDSKRLFGGNKELLIRHDGECYTLRHTSKGKLILTK